MTDSKLLAHQPTKNCAWSRLMITKIFSRLEQAHIILTDQDGVRHFGDDQSSTVINIHIVDHRAYRNFIFGGSIGAAESYVEGQWQTDNLPKLIEVFSRNLSLVSRYENKFSLITNSFSYIRHRLRANSRRGSRTNIAAHYDLSNDLYRLFLDPHLQYSSAIFPHADSDLACAQLNKLAIICDKLQLTAEDHLLEIGTGWGGLAIYAATHFGCKVTSTTISKAQYQYACQQVEALQLGDRVQVCLCDYRDLSGVYSKIVSIEMIEAVGHHYLPTYFSQLNRLVRANGLVLIQAITINDQRYDAYCRSVDFIQQYIFPGGHLPSICKIMSCVKSDTQFTTVSMQDYKEDYARTLKAWRERFLAAKSQILDLGFDEDFIRLWDYYFSYCEGAFRGQAIGLAHLVWRKVSI